ncbi:MAG: hypothetical protein ACREKH_11855, partial [Candidatus Rokuibacteriota bacterium]
GGRRPVQHALAVLPLLVLDTVYVLFFWPRSDPIWFDLGGSLGLIGATMAGGLVVAARRARPGSSYAEPRDTSARNSPSGR